MTEPTSPLRALQGWTDRQVDELRRRFLENVSPEPSSGCWLWTASYSENGYGRFWVGVARGNGSVWQAHRAALLLLRGVEPGGMCACHRCDNRACVNPDHLFLGTYLDNNRDMTAKGRHGYGGLPGESHHQARLTAKQVREIRLARKAGVTGRELASRYGVSGSAIYSAANGRTWGAP